MHQSLPRSSKTKTVILLSRVFPTHSPLCAGVGGKGDIHSEYDHSHRVDAIINKDGWYSKDGRHRLAVNRLTCMPIHSLSNLNYKGAAGGNGDVGGGSPQDHLAALLQVTCGHELLHKSADNWAITLFGDSTGRAPPSQLFALPPFCKSSRFKPGSCTSGGD